MKPNFIQFKAVVREKYETETPNIFSFLIDNIDYLEKGRVDDNIVVLVLKSGASFVLPESTLQIVQDRIDNAIFYRDQCLGK